MGAQRQYTAIFAIGAKLLGSFKGAMSAAQSRMRSLQATAQSIGKGIMKFGALFSGLFAGIAAFGVGAIFKKIFEGADEAAEAAHDRTRRLTAALMTQSKIRAKGREYAEAQVAELYQHNELLAKQGVISKGTLDNAASQLALQKLGPREIAATVGPLADVLVATKGIKEGQELLPQAAFAFGKAVRTGMTRPLQQFGLGFTKPEQKIMSQLAKAGDLKGAYDMLMKKVLQFSGESARALKTPEGRIHALDNAIAGMRKNIGLASEESRAKMADAWRGVLPKLEPIFIRVRKMGYNMMASIANYISEKGMPVIDAFVKMTSKLGKAFTDQFSKMTASGKSFGDVAAEKLIAFFNWVGDNAPAIIRVIEGLTAALIALAAVSFIQGNIVILGIAAAVMAIAKVSSEYQKFKDLINGELVSDPEHFTKHWYLMNQSWTEVWAGLQGSWETMKSTWEGIVNYLKFVWQSFIDKINIFKPPKWWTDFWKDQTAEAKKHYDSTQGLRDADNAAAAKQAADQQAYYEKYGRGITRTPTAAEAAAAVGAVQATPAAMLARPIGRMGREPFLPAIARPMEEHAVLPILGMEKSVLSVSQSFDAMFGDLQTQVNPALVETNTAIVTALIPAIEDASEAFSLFAAQMGLGGAAGGAVGGGGFGGGAAGPAGAAALAPITSAAANLPMSPGALANIQAERSDFIKELQKPELQNLVSATLSTEMQSAEGQKDVLEALVNRSVAYKRAGKYAGMEHMIKGGFYGPYNRGVTSAVMRSGLTPEREKQVAGMIEEMKTRNVLRGMTDQGVNVGRRAYVRGEGYSYGHGVATAAYQGAKEAAATAPATDIPPYLKAMASGGIVKRPTLSLLGERGPEAVVPLRGRAGSSPTHVNFAPTITINGNASAAEQAAMDTKLRDLSRDFVAKFKAAQTQERRLSYEGGYG